MPPTCRPDYVALCVLVGWSKAIFCGNPKQNIWRIIYETVHCSCPYAAAALATGLLMPLNSSSQTTKSMALPPEVIACYRGMAKGFRDKKPDAIFTFWASDYTTTRSWSDSNSVKVLDTIKAEKEVKSRFPGTKKGLSEVYIARSTTGTASKVTANIICYSIDPNDPAVEIGLLKEYVPHWSIIIDGSEWAAAESASKRLPIICSRANRDLHLIAETGKKTKR